MADIKKSIKVRKKISLEVNLEFLRIIDELVKLTKSNRTLVMEAIIGKGFSPFFDYLENTWKDFLKNRPKGKKEGLEKALKDLKKIREESCFLDTNSLKKLLDKKDLDEKKKREIIRFLKECEAE